VAGPGSRVKLPLTSKLISGRYLARGLKGRVEKGVEGMYICIRGSAGILHLEFERTADGFAGEILTLGYLLQLRPDLVDLVHSATVHACTHRTDFLEF
jgi:hypothetical protein